MKRGIRAPLSPNEEVALRRVATGLAQPASSPSRDLEHLKKLGLIVEVDGILSLTSVGRDRCAKLPSAVPPYKASSADKVDEALATFFDQARR
jgi:hypothetical protein